MLSCEQRSSNQQKIQIEFREDESMKFMRKYFTGKTAQIYDRARALLDQHGLTDWDVTFQDFQSKFFKEAYSEPDTSDLLGACDRGCKLILLNRNVQVREVRQIMLHEIAHALRGAGGHDDKWVRIAQNLGCTSDRLSPYQIIK
jgi:hypothetical protein